MVLETFRQALQNVWSNKLRTFLTMLGIIIGVMAVIVIVGLGNGMTRSMRDSFSAMGTNTLSIQIWGYGSRTATVDDLYDLVKKNPKLLSSISPQLDFSDNTPKVGTTTYRYSEMYGVDENYIEMKGYTLAKGRHIQYMDIADLLVVCDVHILDVPALGEGVALRLDVVLIHAVHRTVTVLRRPHLGGVVAEIQLRRTSRPTPSRTP